MALEELLTGAGIGEILGDEYFLAQVGVLALTFILFLCSLVLCIMTVRAAGSAGKARLSAQDLAAEVRHLTAQIEQTRERKAYRDIPTNDAGHDASEPGLDENFADGPKSEADGTLEAAKKAATVPSALLSGFLRRR